MKICHLDFETRSDLDLRKVGLHVYARGKNTDILCAGYAFDNEAVYLWWPGDPFPQRLADHIKQGGEIHAHNANFEFELANNAGHKVGFPEVHIEQMTCTMAMAYAMSLPGSLEGCAAALGIHERKDLEGGRVMLQLSKPREIRADGSIVWWDDFERLQRLGEYCRQDVVVERAAGRRMLRLSPYEVKIWEMDQRINSRGIAVDIPTVTNAMILVEKEKDRLNAEIQVISNGQISTCTAVQQIKDYLAFYGIAAESIDKASILELLAGDIHPTARRVLELRQEAGKATTSKFASMLTRASPEDHRVRGAYQYSGANTRRWAGRGLQLQNLQRPTFSQKTIEQLCDAIGAGMNAEELTILYGPPLTILSGCVRAFLQAGDGCELITGDFSAIEARVIAWLAGQEDVLLLFAKGEDVYVHAASAIFGVPPHAISSDQRQVGKVAILALGYGGGVKAFQEMARGYGVQMAPAYTYLWGRADQRQRDWVEKAFKENGKKFEISREEYIASDLTKTFWRLANPLIVEYWEDLEAAVIIAVREGKRSVGHGNRQVVFLKKGSFLWCQLPSGGVLCYPYPEIRKTVTPWGQEKDLLTYMSEEAQSRKWIRVSTYGGSLAENITQAVSRDIQADAMLRLDSRGYPIVLHTHDEIACELPIGEGSLSEMSRIMSQVPAWAEGLPIAVKGWSGKRYRKE